MERANPSEIRDAFVYIRHARDEMLSQDAIPPLPAESDVDQAAASLAQNLPKEGCGLFGIAEHIEDGVAPGLNGSSLSPFYYGFVTGGVTPAAGFADNWVSLLDQNASVHLPKESIATIVEDRAMSMLLELIGFEPNQWTARTLTTGATASNILGLACGRQFAVSERLRRVSKDIIDGEGILSACRRAEIDEFQVLSTMPHSSLAKAASVVGLGSSCLIDVSGDDDDIRFDMEKLSQCLSKPKTASIVVISCADVHTGRFATRSSDVVRAIRKLCDEHGAWLHVDGAFGLFASVLPKSPEFEEIRCGIEGLDLADSITTDGHKLLNVPYDCGVFFSRHLDISSDVFKNANAAYLKGDEAGTIPSPLNIGIENSRRFRGLPLYASLVAYGRDGYTEMITNTVHLARRVAMFIQDDCPHLELLPQGAHRGNMESIFMIVLFRAVDNDLNQHLVQNINRTRKIYVSGTSWDGKPAARIAVSKWNVDVERHLRVIKDVLMGLRHDI